MTDLSPDLPAEMAYIDLPRYGGPEVLTPARGPLPVPGEGEVLLRVASAGVNRPDVLQRTGNYAPPPGASLVPGLEVSGTVVAQGPGATLPLGAEVCALVAGGGYAEFCTAPEPQCLPVPAGMTLADAAALPETFFTVWTNVFERGRLVAGETVLIHGGSSGIGTTAIQLAVAFGARVVVTVGSAEKAAACLALGAERAVNYRAEDFVAAVHEMTDGRGVELVLDMVGGDYVARNIEALAVEGRLVQIAFQRPSRMEIDLLPMMLKRLTLTGSTLRPRSVAEKGAIAAALKEKVWPLIEAGTVRPVIHSRFALAEAAAAHALMDSSRHIGKILLDC